MKFWCILLSFIVGFFLITLIIMMVMAFTITESDENFEVTIIHINDFHARFEETNNFSLPCRESQVCIGGYSRMASVVKQLQRERKNPIFLNAADNFQGTIWYSMFRYNVTSYFLNLIPADAMTIGNHEFAHNVNGLVLFLKQLTSSVVVANIDDSEEPILQNLYKKSVVIERSGRKIGIIGAIYRGTSEIAMTGKLRFTNEIEAIRKEAEELSKNGINIIIALTHCGLSEDIKVAEEVGDLVDIVVGGHSHSFLFSAINSKFPGLDTVTAGPYPIVVSPKHDPKRNVPVVQAFAFARYVGDLRVTFDASGNVKTFQGNPIYLGPDVAKDPEIEKRLIPWRKKVEEISKRIVGSTNVDLLNDRCWYGECAVGSFTADAIVSELQLSFPEYGVKLAILQSSGMRSSFNKGPITYGEIVTFMPFGNTFDLLELNGISLIAVFEHAVSRSWRDDVFIAVHMLQISGIQVTFNTTKPLGSRVVSLRIKNEADKFEDVEHEKFYAVAMPTFLVYGGDGYVMITENKINHRAGLFDVDVMEAHVERKSPIDYDVDGRIVMLI